MEVITSLMLVLHATSVTAGSHSIWGFATFITGGTLFPEFSAVVMVDDVQVLYYDSNIRKLISRGHQNSSDGDDRS
ncbi:hypothetical protein AGOR_G00140930 [Albula goreensis]|uniref:Uncharacterized protein n=1 Tax=Albula goreensis TaxID=1534307 RepID=A0A8T3DDX8_9TELE|nr:hypothetical protein AGOR_G00140930 [Albula goreensis]